MLLHFENGTNKAAEWQNMSKTALIDFVRHMKNKMAQSSVRTYAAMFKSVLNDYKEEVELPKNFEDALSVKGVQCINAYMNERDIRKFANYAPKSKQEKYVQCVFMLGCMTGARHSDCVMFTKGNFMGENFAYVSEKTNKKTIVPMSPIVARLISELPTATPVNDANFNLIVRRIAKSAGIRDSVKVFRAGKYEEGERYKFIASHTARRSFATNLYLRGADLYNISKRMGHSDIKMTEGYVCCGLREQSEKVMKYFKKYE